MVGFKRVSALTPPKADELEISIFGPGRGECIVIHAGDNEWCIVDSCIARERTESAAVEYLRLISTDALQNVKMVVATHWHDDHIGGLSSLLKITPNAKFCCSMALKQDEFLALVASATETITGRSGVDEFVSILNYLREQKLGSPKFAVENKSLLDMSAAGRSFHFNLTSLSPSDRTIELALKEIASQLPKVGQPQQRIINRSPNHASVVLWITAGEIRALLGADLQQTGKSGEGWNAVIACQQDTTKARFFKIPHHGSINSDYAPVWETLLSSEPRAAVTPYRAGPSPLPKISDFKRLKLRTPHVYCTSRGSGKPPTRDTTVERAMKMQTPDRKVLEGLPGQVRIRWSATNPGEDPTIECFNGGYHVPS
jgi:hypothetical protein